MHVNAILAAQQKRSEVFRLSTIAHKLTVFAVLAAASSPVFAEKRTIHDLGTLPGGFSSYASPVEEVKTGGWAARRGSHAGQFRRLALARATIE